MRGFVTVLSTDEFQKWVEGEETKLKEQGADPFK
jgi:heme/copper-type cytochrome/quinol oxidase subunit 2